MEYRLTDLCELIMGQSPDSSSCNKDGKGIPFYQGNADFGEKNPTPRNWCLQPKKIAQKDDILISVRAPIGDLNIANEDCCIGRGVAAIRMKSKECDRDYLYLFLESKSKYLQDCGTGSTFTAINKGVLESLKVKCPELKNQTSIANEIENIKAAIKYKNSELICLNEAVQSEFVEMFGAPDLSPQRTDWTELKNITTIFTGTTPSTTDEENWNGDILWITPAEMTSDSFYIYDTERKITSKGQKSKSLSLMPVNTVLLSTRAPIGKVGIAGAQMTCNQGFKNFYCKEDVLNPVYLYFLFKSNTDYLNSKGTGTTFKELSKSVAEKIKVPVPPLDLQIKFASFVEQIDKSKFVVKQQIADLQELLDSKMQEYFS